MESNHKSGDGLTGTQKEAALRALIQRTGYNLIQVGIHGPILLCFILKLHWGCEQPIHAPESLLARSFSLCFSRASVLAITALFFTKQDLIPQGIPCLMGNYNRSGGRTTLSTAKCWEKSG